MGININKIFTIFFFLCFIHCLYGKLTDRQIKCLNIKKYTLKYTIDFEKDEFVGTVDIDFTVKSSDILDDTIALDSEALQIDEVSLKDPNKMREIQFKTFKYNVTLNLETKLLTRVNYVLSLSFRGTINDIGVGIFKHQAYNSKYITTNLYPFNARKAFPCFNDVQKKSIFSLTIMAKGANNIVALSNMPLNVSSGETNFFVFKDTPNIQVHNLFFTLGKYQKSKMNENIYVPTELMTFNTELENVLENKEYKNFLKISQLSPVKFVCVPGLTKPSITGYGIVALSEYTLFMDFEKITTEQRKISLLNMYYAVYKLFYGSILTPASWSDSWLVESIPIYLQYNGLSELTEWGDPNDYIFYDIQQTVLQSNANLKSRPIVDKSLETEQNVLDFLEGTIMLKGAGVLTMLEKVLSKQILTDVIMDFFEKKFNTPDVIVTTDDFVNFLSTHKAVQEKLDYQINLKDIINTWLLQGGYPYLQTKRDGSDLSIDENVFINGIPTVDSKLWKFPIFYASGNNPNFNDDKSYFWLLLDKNRTVSLNFTVPPDEWIIMNVNGSGIYRVNYESNDWINLAIALTDNHNIFPASTRAKLISDAFAMLHTEHAMFSKIFSFFSYLQYEESPIPWLTALDGFNYLWSLLYNTDLRNEFDNYMVDILTNIYSKLGINKNTVDKSEGTLRQKIVSAMCHHGYQQCLDETKKCFNNMNNCQFSNDVRPVIVCNGLRRNPDKWKQLFNETFDDKNVMGKDVKKVYFEAFACPLNDDDRTGSLTKFLDLIFLHDDIIIKEDINSAFKAIYSNPEHITEALEYFLINEHKARTDISTDDKVRMLNDISLYLTRDEEIKTLQKYINVIKPGQALYKAAGAAMNTINSTQQFLQRHYKELKEALRTFEPTVTTDVPPTKTTLTTSPTSVSPTTTTANPNATTTTTAKPSAASHLYISNLFLILLFYIVLQFIH